MVLKKLSGLPILVAFLGLCRGILPSLAATPIYEVPGLGHCFMCPNGTKVDQDCPGNLTISTCLPCENHYYQDEPNGLKHCKLCTTACHKNGVVAQICTNITNMICMCQPGYHRYPLDPIDPFFECKEHTGCGEGEGEAYPGNFTHDRKCRKCELGKEFVDKTDTKHPVCKICRKCPEGKCTLLEDAKCDDNSSFVVEDTTTSFLNHDPDTPGGMNAGYIFLIVYLSLLLIGVGAAAAAAWLLKKERRSGDLNVLKCEMFVIVISILCMVGIFAVIWVIKRIRKRNKPQIVVEEILLVPPEVVQVDHWPQDFIKGKVFPALTRTIADYRSFIRSLPGWKAIRVQVVIQHSEEEHSQNVSEQFHKCLTVWSQECHNFVTKEIILKVLRDLNLNEVAEQLQVLRPEHHQNSENGGSRL